MTTLEANFDGLPGPTHHYGGLSAGNLASQQNKQAISHPRAAAFQGLAKMRLLLELGLPQGILPPPERPHWAFLRAQGFHGTAAEVIASASKQRPDLLSIASSAAAMWAANAATVSPSHDTADGKVHFTIANLRSTPHRRLESEFTHRVFQKLFGDERFFRVHAPLPDKGRFADEGAANALRLSTADEESGLEVGVYGWDDLHPTAPRPVIHPARQTRSACSRIFEQHGCRNTLLVQQSPAAIDAGAFHNDVVAVANENVLFCHALAWRNQPEFLQQLQQQFHASLHVIEVSPAEMSLADAVATYLFNSQLVTLPDSGAEQRMLLLAPQECAEHPAAQQVIARLLADDNPVREVRYVDLRQSMRNGGGPACLRLRVPLTMEQRDAVQGNVWLNAALLAELERWVTQHYREQLSLADLADPALVRETHAALDELTQLLDLPGLYDFQQ